MKKLSLCLAVVSVLLLVFSLSSCDREEKTSVGLKFELNEDGESYTVVGLGTCNDEHIIIDTHKKKPITAVADGAFKSEKDIKACTGAENLIIRT